MSRKRQTARYELPDEDWLARLDDGEANAYAVVDGVLVETVVQLPRAHRWRNAGRYVATGRTGRR